MTSRTPDGSSRAGKCLCGDITYAFSGEPLRSTVCHCATCRRRTGSLFSAHLWFEPNQLTFTGSLSSYSFTTDSGRTIVGNGIDLIRRSRERSNPSERWVCSMQCSGKA